MQKYMKVGWKSTWVKEYHSYLSNATLQHYAELSSLGDQLFLKIALSSKSLAFRKLTFKGQKAPSISKSLCPNASNIWWILDILGMKTLGLSMGGMRAYQKKRKIDLFCRLSTILARSFKGDRRKNTPWVKRGLVWWIANNQFIFDQILESHGFPSDEWTFEMTILLPHNISLSCPTLVSMKKQSNGEAMRKASTEFGCHRQARYFNVLSEKRITLTLNRRFAWNLT